MSFKIEKRLLYYLGIRWAEKNRVYWSLIWAFLTGWILCYTVAIPLTLFLHRFGSADLPRVCLVAAFLSILTGIIYTFFEYRVSHQKLIQKLLFMIAFITTLFWCFLKASDNASIVALVMVWAIVAYGLLDMSVWSILNSIYSLEQGKRLFGVINASQSLGGTLSGLSLPLLLLWLNVKTIILIIGLLLFFSLWILKKVLSLHSQPAEQKALMPTIAETNTIRLPKILTNSYLIKLFVLAALSIFVMEIVDLAFNTVARERFPNEVVLAGFLGIFYGTFLEGLNLVISTFLFKRILKRIGLISSFMVLPIVIMIPLIVLCSSKFISFSLLFIFAWVIILKLLEASLRTAVNEVNLLLLLQPLAPTVRAFVLSKMDIFIRPLASALISVALLAFIHYFGIVIPVFALTVLVLSFFTLWITHKLRQDYVKALFQAIRNRFLNVAELKIVQRDSLPILYSALKSPFPEVVVQALSIIENIDPKKLFEFLPQALCSKEPLVRLYGLDKIKKYNAIALCADILNLIVVEENETIKAQAIRLLSDLSYTKHKALISSYLLDKSVLIQYAAMLAIYKQGSAQEKDAVVKKIESMIYSKNDDLQKSAAFLIGEMNEPAINQKLLILLSGPSQTISSEALIAAIKTTQIECFPIVLKHLDKIHLSGEILENLLKASSFIMPEIQEKFLQYSRTVQVKLLYLLSHMKDPEARVFLEELALSTQGELYLHALRALAYTNPVGNKHSKEKFTEKMQAEVHYLHQKMEFLEKVPALDETFLLRSVLNRKIRLSVERMLLLISIYYPGKPMLKVRMGLLSEYTDDVDYAIELLEAIMNESHKRTVLPILKTIYFATSEMPAELLDIQALAGVIRYHLQINDEDNLTILGCISCLYIIKQRRLQGFESEIDNLKSIPIPIIQETLLWLREA